MKKLLIIGLIFVMVFSMVALASPAYAKSSGGGGGSSVGDGEPPGWSQVNPGGGGSDGPGDSPGSP